MQFIRVGIVGCGSIATTRHIPSLLQVPGVSIGGVYDTDPERAAQTAERFAPAGKAFASAQELFQDPGIDAVHVCTPNNTHCELAVAALRGGKHVLCEKPMAITGGDAAQMTAAARESGKLLTVGYQNRFGRNAMHLKKLCAAGKLGEIYHAKAYAVRRRGVPTWGVFLNKEIQGGGCLIDIGTHALDLTLWLMGNYEPDYVVCSTYNKLGTGKADAANCWGPWDPGKFQVEDAAFGFIKMKNGATVTVDCSWALNTRHVLEGTTLLAGTEAGADLLDGLTLNGEEEGKLYIKQVDTTNQSGTRLPIEDEENIYDLQMADWIGAIREGREPMVRADEAEMVCRILEAMYRSAEQGEPVYL